MTYGRLNSQVHEPDPGRPCVHAITTPPRSLIVRYAPVAALNFQPRIITADAPCIAARMGDTLIIGFDLIGHLTMRHPQRGTRTRDHRVKNWWRYTLRPIDGEPDLLLAVQEQARREAVGL